LAEICLFFFVWVCNPQTDAQFTSLRVQVSSIYCPVSNGQTEYKCAKKSYRAKQSRHVVISTGIICALFVVVGNTQHRDRQTKVKLLLLSPPFTISITIFNFGEVFQCNTTLWSSARYKKPERLAFSNQTISQQRN
jgi:hypothetical protein